MLWSSLYSVHCRSNAIVLNNWWILNNSILWSSGPAILWIWHINGLVQDCSISIAKALGNLHLALDMLAICFIMMDYGFVIDIFPITSQWLEVHDQSFRMTEAVQNDWICKSHSNVFILHKFMFSQKNINNLLGFSLQKWFQYKNAALPI